MFDRVHFMGMSWLRGNLWLADGPSLPRVLVVSAPPSHRPSTCQATRRFSEPFMGLRLRSSRSIAGTVGARDNLPQPPARRQEDQMTEWLDS